jgi:hypothetical protein
MRHQRSASSLASRIGSKLLVQRSDLCLERLCHRDRNHDLLACRVRDVDLPQPVAAFAAEQMELGAVR